MADMTENHAKDLLDAGTIYRVTGNGVDRLVLEYVSGPRQPLPRGERVIVRKA